MTATDNQAKTPPESELVTAICTLLSASCVSPTLKDEIVRAVREEIAPLVKLASVPHQEYLDENAAAFYCGTTAKTLQTYRSRGRGPVYIKDGGKVLYSRKDIDQYMEKRKVKIYEQH